MVIGMHTSIVTINTIVESGPDSETSIVGWMSFVSNMIANPLMGMCRHIISRLFLPHHDSGFVISFEMCRFVRSILNIITAKQPKNARIINM